jgi:hypothetical protein
MTSKLYEMKAKISALTDEERKELLEHLQGGKGSDQTKVSPHSITLVQTCNACPEQYDAFLGKKQVGYLRLRHGEFRVDVPGCCEETIFEAEAEGDGIFESWERESYLLQAKTAIAAWLDDHPEHLHE